MTRVAKRDSSSASRDLRRPLIIQMLLSYMQVLREPVESIRLPSPLDGLSLTKFPAMQSVSSRAPEETYRVRVLKGGGEYGPAVSVYWNDRLNEYIDLNYYLVLIQNDKRRILINTGMPADFLAFHEQNWSSEASFEYSQWRVGLVLKAGWRF